MKAATATRPRTKRSRRSAKGGPNPVDIYVGARLRLRRTLLGISQDKLGQALGLTFQQVQKYERGANRIGSSRLYQLGLILHVPVSYFFDEMPVDVAMGQRVPGAPGFGDQSQQPYGDDSLNRRETLELARAYYRITDPKVRKQLFELTKSLSRPVRQRKRR
ncbi:MAG: helix-turn-helix transcriptional regulator [Rhodospirillales bacterium]|jgi:transcriptional regulator with XRE-family HTH domain|nr:helix-turn-helix transcriptional regulator [Rhodospirillales bacterium]